MSGNGRLTVAHIDTLVAGLRGVGMRLADAGAGDDAATVGRAANALDSLANRLVMHAMLPSEADADGATQ